MVKHLRAAALVVVAVGLCAAIAPGTAAQKENPQLTVHEWGTFTSIAGPDGQAVPWRPLSGPSDLPCFVTTANPNSIKVDSKDGIPGLKALVRMETPVLYFYSAEAMTARVSVGFPQGLFSEWYPQASVSMAQVPSTAWRWQINWPHVEITPGAKEAFPTEPGESHYYAARETDAAPVRVGTQQEKFLFYRGIATFTPSIIATIARDGSVSVGQQTGDPIETFVLFERRGGRFGYRVVSTDRSALRIERPELTGTLDSLRRDLQDMLIQRGLYRREAAAMVETWHDSWFEEGTRLLYVLPQSTVDGILPIEIEPKPAKMTRVFVGRMEVVTPEMESDIAAAIHSSDQTVLRKYGRFLEPIFEMIRPHLAAAQDEQKIAGAVQLVTAKQASGSLCAAKPATNAKATPPFVQ